MQLCDELCVWLLHNLVDVLPVRICDWLPNELWYPVSPSSLALSFVGV